MFCSQCGKEIDPNSRFCPNCGVKNIRYQKQQEENELLRIQNDLLKKNQVRKKIPEQTTAKMTFSILALIFIIAGFYFPFYKNRKNQGKISDWEKQVKVISNVTDTAAYIDDFLGEKNNSEMSEISEVAKKILTYITILKIILVISIILLLINIFIPVKAGLLLTGFAGIIITIMTAIGVGTLIGSMSGEFSEKGFMIGGYVIILGFALEMIADPGLRTLIPKQNSNNFM